MLKEYLSEAVSLLTEAVFGAPVKAQAHEPGCWNTGYDCIYPCSDICGVEKRVIKDRYCCPDGHCYCKGGACHYC